MLILRKSISPRSATLQTKLFHRYFEDEGCRFLVCGDCAPIPRIGPVIRAFLFSSRLWVGALGDDTFTILVAHACSKEQGAISEWVWSRGDESSGAIMAAPAARELRSQGWKLHISATVRSAEEILRRIATCLGSWPPPIYDLPAGFPAVLGFRRLSANACGYVFAQTSCANQLDHR
jgi:hypothetical protein